MMRSVCGIVALCVLAGTLKGQEPKQDKPFQLMEEKRYTAFKNMLPKVKDENLQKIFDDPATLLYTDDEIPKAHQDWEGALQGLHSPTYNISANRNEPFGNGNREFPWGGPAGTHLSKSTLGSFRFLSLPRGDDGKVWPVVWYQQDKYHYKPRVIRGVQRSVDESRNGHGYAWIFPKGTVVGEVLYIRDSKGYDHTYEVRIRSRALDRWIMNAYRPFPTNEHLLKAIQKARPGWRDDTKLVAFVKHLESPLATDVYTLADVQPDQRVFEQSRCKDDLPPLDEDLVAELLDKTTFVSALGTTWKGEGKYAPHAPSTEAKFHIVPHRYTAGFIDVSSKSCMQCHTSTNQSVNEFDLSRDWYGRVRGSDGIFSFHPFAKSSISYDGIYIPIKMNAEMTNAGLIAQYAAKTHPETIYKRISELK